MNDLHSSMPAKSDIPATYAVTTYCITHTDPEIPHSDETVQLEIGPPGTLDPKRYPNVANCFDLAPYGRTYRRELGSTLGSFAARHHILQSGRPLDFAVNMASYRTFMMADRFAGRSHDVLKLNFMTPDEARVLGDIAFPSTTPLMWRLPMPIPVGSLARNYGSVHHSKDLDLYLDVAMAEGVLSREDNDECRNRPHLLPGAFSVGMMPAQVFCDLNEPLEVVTRGFLEQFSPEGRDDYQIRAANFCHERLGGYLLERYIRQTFDGLDPQLFGYWTRVDADLTYSRGHITAKPA